MKVLPSRVTPRTSNLGSPIQVRPAIASDANAIAEIHVRTWQVAYPGIVPADYLASLSVDRYEAMWGGHIAKGLPHLLVAVEPAQMLGWVAFGPSRDADADPATAEIWAIYVGAAHWHRGVGRELWRHVQRQLQAQGFQRVSLWAFPENVRADRFYRSIGFEVEPGSGKQFTLGGAALNEIRYLQAIGA